MTATTLTLIRTTMLGFGLAVALFLSSCAFTSTGASMRVEVEVYKGPLSKSKEVQLDELFGVIRGG